MLVGGGHAHVQVLRRWAMDPPPGARLLVVLDQPTAVYSGMVPGLVAGDYPRHALEIDVVPLARRAGAGVILAAATDLDPVRREISLVGRPPLHYDLVSLDVGSTVRGLDLPGVAEHALTTRPIGRFVGALDPALTRLSALKRAPRVVIAGSGAAGVELSFCLDARLGTLGLRPQIVLVAAEATLFEGASRATRRALSRELERSGIEARPGHRVVRVTEDGVFTRSNSASTPNDEQFEPADLVVWATGAAPISFPAQQGTAALPTDAAGFLEVRDTLQTVGFDEVFAVGDCARLASYPWVPRAGVYAVRQGPILWHNLRAQLAGRRLRPYRPQRDFLALLNLGAGRALGSKWGLALAGRPVHRLKDRIDRRFMRRFQVLDPQGSPFPALADLGAMSGGEGPDEEMSCGGCAAKLGAAPLEAALNALPSAPPDESVLLGLAARDDVAATQLDGRVTLHNVDVIRSFCDDPWLVGRVAASNALSDLHAKGGIPRHAQAIIGLPELAPGEARERLFQTLSGLRSVLDPLGVSLLGGHTTIGEDLTVGLSVSGEGPAAADLLRQVGARPGDALLLTQPVGTGVVLAADMQGLARGEWVTAAHAVMQRTNHVAGRLAGEVAAQASTDVTGFGLAGHLLSLLGSGLSVCLERTALPLLPGARALWRAGHRSTAHPANREAFAARVRGASDDDEAWLFDPQTAGGLLLAISENEVEKVLRAFSDAGEPPVGQIGRFVAAKPDSPGSIEILD